MRVVVDCNVVIAAARTEGVCRAALLNVVRHHQLVLSAPIIREYRTVGARPKHKPYHRTMLAITDLLEQVASIVEPAAFPFGLNDPDDEIHLSRHSGTIRRTTVWSGNGWPALGAACARNKAAGTTADRSLGCHILPKRGILVCTRRCTSVEAFIAKELGSSCTNIIDV